MSDASLVKLGDVIYDDIVVCVKNCPDSVASLPEISNLCVSFLRHGNHIFKQIWSIF